MKNDDDDIIEGEFTVTSSSIAPAAPKPRSYAQTTADNAHSQAQAQAQTSAVVIPGIPTPPDAPRPRG